MLQFFLFVQGVSAEFYHAFQLVNPRLFTTHPPPVYINDPSYDDKYNIDHKNSLPGPVSLPPAARTFYMRWIRGIPVFKSRGEQFLKVIDDFVELEFIYLLSTWMMATKFDLNVSFACVFIDFEFLVKFLFLHI